MIDNLSALRTAWSHSTHDAPSVILRLIARCEKAEAQLEVSRATALDEAIQIADTFGNRATDDTGSARDIARNIRNLRALVQLSPDSVVYTSNELSAVLNTLRTAKGWAENVGGDLEVKLLACLNKAITQLESK